MEQLLEFVMRDDGLSIQLNTHSISRIALEFLIKDNESVLQPKIKAFDVMP